LEAGTPALSRVGWIGLGRIGAPMAERVRAAGWPICLWARRPDRAPAGWAAPTVQWVGEPLQLLEHCDTIVTVVSGPDDVQQLHTLLMPAARPGTVFIDLSTALPATAHHAAQLAASRGLVSIECPVTGGVAGAQRGSLTGFAGGDDRQLAAALPLLQSFCQRVVPCGPAGSGYRTKLVNQALVAGVLMGLADGTRLARAAGMPAEWLKSTLATGTGGSALFESYVERMMSGAGPVTFTLGLLLKDLRLARSECAALGLDAPLLDAALASVQRAADRHGADAGVQALAL
jgi:3-hydroxyisobutyrate dehydrogenase-like beta-hydroxyacid dehydrogenase